MSSEGCRHRVGWSTGQGGDVSCARPVIRYTHNPILTARDVNKTWQDPAFQVVTVHNAGAASYEEGVVLMFRSHLRCGISVIGAAFSANGVDNWRISQRPVLTPAQRHDNFAPGVDKDPVIESESGGVEDPRIVKLGDVYTVTYSAYHARIRNRMRVHLAATYDFVNFIRYGRVIDIDMRNVAFFSEPFDRRYAGLFRPNDTTSGDIGGQYTRIRLGWTGDWRRGPWTVEDKPLMETGAGPSAFSDKIGPGAPPVKTRDGWLNLFHGVRTTMAGNPYVLGVALHDLKDPSQVQMSSIPVLFPSNADCRVADTDYVHVPNVVFSCGCIRRDDGTILIYYGGNDTVMNLGVTHEEVLIKLCKEYGQDPLTGRLLYSIHG